MSEKQPNIVIPVDLTNPGQFFACCGLLELAGRLWPGAEGWFERRQFHVAIPKCGIDNGPLAQQNEDTSAPTSGVETTSNLLPTLLTETKNMRFDVGDDAESESDDEQEDSGPVQPIELRWRDDRFAILLDWWEDRSIKPWAGSMNEREILHAMLSAIDPTSHDPFNDLRLVQYQPPNRSKPGKKEPFYFDPRRGNKSHPLDSGFSTNTQKMESECCPALEALCFIGLQRARPEPTGVVNRSKYTVWPKVSPTDPGISANLMGAVTCGLVRFSGSSTYVFDNYFRSDKRTLKSFSQAVLERSLNASLKH